MKSIQIILIGILLIYKCNFIYSQITKEVNIWYFGSNAGLDFNGGAPVAITNGALSTFEGTSSACDASGSLLFYTNGVTVWNKNHLTMTNGTGLLGCSHSCQSALVVKKPGSSNLYYIFTTDATQCTTTGLHYSIVDMSASGGLGSVTTKNTLLLSSASEAITACKHSNNTDIWVLNIDRTASKYYAYLVTASGINTPVITNATFVMNAGYCAKFSNDTRYIAFGMIFSNEVRVENFDNSTGAVTDYSSYTVPSTEYPYGLEFSPDNTKLYIMDQGGTPLWALRQYELCSKTGISIASGSTGLGGNLQMGPDGKIYVDRFGVSTLGVINNPDSLGLACNFNLTGINLAGKTTQLGLPNFIVNYFYNKVIVGGVTARNNSPLCEGKTLNLFSDTLSSVNYSWQGPNGFTSTLQNPVIPGITSVNAGMYIVTVTKGCQVWKDTVDVIINPKPSAKFTVNDSTQCLNNNNFIFTNATTLSSGSFTSLWKFGDNDTAVTKDASHSYSSTGTYVVKLITTSDSGCVDSISHKVYIFPNANAKFTINDSTQCLKGNNVVFTNTSTITTGTKWYFGDGDTANTLNSSHVYTSAGIYIVKLLVGSNMGCRDSVTKKVYIYPSPVVNFSINDSTQCLKGNNVIFTNNSFISAPGTFTSSWNFGDGNIANTLNASRSYTSSNTYSVNLVVTSNMGCKDSITKRVFIYPSPNVDFSINDTSQCLSNNNFTFTNLSSVIPGSFTSRWTFGDGGTSAIKNPVHTYSAINTFKVKLVVTTDKFCVDSVIKNVTITAKTIKPVLTCNSPVCEGDTLKIFNDSLIGSIYSWSGPNGFSSNKPDVVIPNSTKLNSGLYNVIRTKNGCPSDTSKINFIVNPIPDTPIVTGNFNLCEGQRLQFNTQSVPGSIFSWHGPNGFVSGQQNPVIDPASQNNSGIYTVSVTINNCKSKDIRIPVIINPRPYLNLGKDTVICQGDVVLLDAGMFDSYLWQDSSSGRNLTVSTAGTYWVTVTNQYGCLCTDTIKVGVECPPTIFVPNVFTPNGDNINDTFEVKGENITEYEIIIYNRWGEEMFRSNDIKINWDGRYKGTLCSDGVYYWLIFYGGHYKGVIIRKFIHGTATLLK